MSNISKMRDIADSLTAEGNYDKAFVIYDEINSQIWRTIGSVQQGITDFSRGYLNQNVMLGIEFRNMYSYKAISSVFIKQFNLDIDQTQNEFMFSLYGHLNCLVHSKLLSQNISTLSVLNEFLTLATLINSPTNDNWAAEILKYSTPIVDGGKLVKLRTNLQTDRLTKKLVELARKLKNTDWSHTNILLLDYLGSVGERNSAFYSTIRDIGGNRKTSANKKKRTYRSYTKYEKYERYERYEYKEEESEKEFDHKNATDKEKLKYYGNILGLTGVLSKSQIKQKYLSLIAQYHPDKVNSLGKELIELAEKKTKEINLAFEWLKNRYNI